MSNWRPPNWKELIRPKIRACIKRKNKGYLEVVLGDLVEAGADAYWEALKVKGHYFPAGTKTPWQLPLGAGWQVFIPDEEKVKVMCSYCQEIVEVDKSTADALSETTAFCCKECSGSKDANK